ncbi:MAG: hypothetical protein U5K69_14370 [Balneolaceae bacterium]|nr:hypothetical protein [Balneolaceae bacterium]
MENLNELPRDKTLLVHRPNGDDRRPRVSSSGRKNGHDVVLDSTNTSKTISRKLTARLMISSIGVVSAIQREQIDTEVAP